MEGNYERGGGTISAVCDFCTWQLVAKTTERQAQPLFNVRPVRLFRCAVCGRHVETPVSRRHELVWTRKPKPGPLADQLTIYDDV